MLLEATMLVVMLQQQQETNKGDLMLSWKLLFWWTLALLNLFVKSMVKMSVCIFQWLKYDLKGIKNSAFLEYFLIGLKFHTSICVDTNDFEWLSNQGSYLSDHLEDCFLKIDLPQYLFYIINEHTELILIHWITDR